MRARWLAAALAVAAWCAASQARAEATLYRPPACATGDLVAATEEELLRCYAPEFFVRESEHAYNRLGTAVVEPGRLGLRARVDPEQPALYAELQHDTIADTAVLQLVYRVMFEKIPLRFSRYFFEAHRNPGLFVVVTLDAATRTPWFVSTVHTCGCYLGLLPTRNVPDAWLPNDWPQRELEVYGQRLPARLPAFDPRSSRLRAALAASSHRFTAVSVVPTDAGAARSNADVQLARSEGAARDPDLDSRSEDLPLVPLAELRQLPVTGTQRTSSLFYQSGPLRGHVRGAWNPFEGLTLFGLVSLDPTVGMDKDMGDPRETGTPFYTQLSFWKHQDSRLDRFDRLLRQRGFELPPSLETSAGR